MSFDITCRICGLPTCSRGTKLCDNCWEIDMRIDNILRLPKGIEYLNQRLNKYGLAIQKSKEESSNSD